MEHLVELEHSVEELQCIAVHLAVQGGLDTDRSSLGPSSPRGSWGTLCSKRSAPDCSAEVCS